MHSKAEPTQNSERKMDLGDFTKKSSGPFPDCSLFHDRFVRCLQPNVQMKHIYKHGEAENCGEFVQDWKKCMEAKFVKEDAKIKEMYETTHHHLHSLEPGNDVFKYKEKPSWDAN